jgi:hypothetical protein
LAVEPRNGIEKTLRIVVQGFEGDDRAEGWRSDGPETWRRSAPRARAGDGRRRDASAVSPE